MQARAAWRRALLTTTSIVSIAGGALIGGVPSPALAACSTNITGNVAGCTNSTTITGINIHSANVSSSISNTGNINTNGISVNTDSTINGQINDSGTLAGGIKIDNTSSIVVNSTAISIVKAPTFSGGISNAGLISAPNFGPAVELYEPSTFTGGISNSGTISSAKAQGIHATLIATFSGGIANSGTISGGGPGESFSSMSARSKAASATAA